MHSLGQWTQYAWAAEYVGLAQVRDPPPIFFCFCQETFLSTVGAFSIRLNNNRLNKDAYALGGSVATMPSSHVLRRICPGMTPLHVVSPFVFAENLRILLLVSWYTFPWVVLFDSNPSFIFFVDRPMCFEWWIQFYFLLIQLTLQ